MEQLDLGADLAYSKRPIKILDTAKQVTRSKVIKMCKVQWSHHTEDKATWEHEKELSQNFFPTRPNLGGVIPFLGGRSVTPTFCIIKLWQGRSTLGCILERFSLRKRFSQFNFGLRLHSWHGISYFLKIPEKPRRI
jgi:hypothetical protein